MSLSTMDGNFVETEVIEDSSSQPSVTIEQLLAQYNSYKQSDSEQASQTTKKYTLKGLDEVNELVANAMLQIDDFVSTDTPSTLGNIKSKALAILDPKDKWIGKWASKAANESAKVDTKSQTVDEIIKSIRKSIETKRDEVISSANSAFEDRDNLSDRLSYYQDILTQAKAILSQAEPASKTEFSAKLLVNMTTTTIMEIQSTISDDINPLITSAGIAVERIEAMIPTIEAKLQDKLGIKTFQQQLSDLLSVTQVVTDLTNAVDEKVTKSIQDTTLQTMSLLKNSTLDVDRLKSKLHRDNIYRTKLETAISDVQSSVNNEFNKLQALALEQKKAYSSNTQTFISSYTSGKPTSATFGELQ